MSKKDFPELLKDSSIILAISAVMIYIFSYLYIKGFLGFYKLPTDFNVDWSFFMLTQYCVTIIKMFAPILIKCAISCFLIYIFLMIMLEN